MRAQKGAPFVGFGLGPSGHDLRPFGHDLGLGVAHQLRLPDLDLALGVVLVERDEGGLLFALRLLALLQVSSSAAATG